MANNRSYFGNKLTGKFFMLNKHYNDWLFLSNQHSIVIQSLINESYKGMQKEDWRESNNIPFVFFTENDRLYKYFFDNHSEVEKVEFKDYPTIIIYQRNEQKLYKWKPLWYYIWYMAEFTYPWWLTRKELNWNIVWYKDWFFEILCDWVTYVVYMDNVLVYKERKVKDYM